MKKILLCSILMNYFAIAYGKVAQDSTCLPIDTSIISIMPGHFIYMFQDKHSTANLTPSDCKTIEKLLNQCVVEYNIKRRKWAEDWEANHHSKIRRDGLLMELKNSKRQYIVGLNEKGEKEIYVNCFNAERQFRDDLNWRDHLVMVMGGGNAFFRVIINLHNKTYYAFRVNGDE